MAIEQSVTVDVLVIGGGGSGLAAASSAAEIGRTVMLLEKNPKLGGSTAWSVGSVTSTLTPHQLRAGVVDFPDDHWEDFKKISARQPNPDNFELARVLTDNIPQTFQWLMSVGLEFLGPMPEPPHRKPRMHNIIPNSRAFPFHLGRYCRRLGVDIRLGYRAEELVKKDNRISEVIALAPDGSRIRIQPRGGVVLAAGDYSASPHFKGKLISEASSAIDAVNATATGDGFSLALPHGAVMVNGNSARGRMMFVAPQRPKLIQRIPPYRIVTRFIRWSMDHLPKQILRPFIMSFVTTTLGPEADLFKYGAVLINKDGKRYTNELAEREAITAQQPDRIAYIVFDDVLAKRFSTWPHAISTAPGVAYAYLPDYRNTRRDLYRRAPTIAKLAALIGVDADALQRSIEAYNVNATQDGVPGRGERPPIIQAPFYALGPARSFVVFTNGSLMVTKDHEVVDGDGKPISGLFAAGATGQGGLILEGHGHHLGWAFVSGRRAGRNAALFRPAGNSEP